MGNITFGGKNNDDGGKLSWKGFERNTIMKNSRLMPSGVNYTQVLGVLKRRQSEKASDYHFSKVKATLAKREASIEECETSAATGSALNSHLVSIDQPSLITESMPSLHKLYYDNPRASLQTGGNDSTLLPLFPNKKRQPPLTRNFL